MPNYKESTISGAQWTRANRIQIDNPYQGVPSLMFVEEEITQVNNKMISNIVSNLLVSFSSSGEIALINPETGASLGETVSHEKLYVILHSLYIQTAQERDTLINNSVSGS